LLPLPVWQLPILNDFSGPHPGLLRSPLAAARGLLSNWVIRKSSTPAGTSLPTTVSPIFRRHRSMDLSPVHTGGPMIRLWLNSVTPRDIYWSMVGPFSWGSMMASIRLIWSANSGGGEERRISERTLRACRYLLKRSRGRRALASIKVCFTSKRVGLRLRE